MSVPLLSRLQYATKQFDPSGAAINWSANAVLADVDSNSTSPRCDRACPVGDIYLLELAECAARRRPVFDNRQALAELDAANAEHRLVHHAPSILLLIFQAIGSYYSSELSPPTDLR
jgi:hypothetical protein